MKYFKSPIFSLLFIPYLVFILLIFGYSLFIKTIPIAYSDEFYWISKSYFFEFYTNDDFKNEIWQMNEASYDEPKLAEYAFGAWLYPRYLYEKTNHGGSYFDYIKYLIKNGFYLTNEPYIDTYADYQDSSNIIEYDGYENSFPEEYVAKYGIGSLKPINLIYQIRILNIFFLASAVVFAYFVVLNYAGLVVAIIFTFFYGFNSLIIESGLRAHSEALFLFTFNIALLFMSLYFTKKRNFYYLILFSVFTGLSMSTKLNGVMLVIIFFFSNMFLFVVSKVKKNRQLIQGILPALISIIIFVDLNPFTYTDPLKNVKGMYDWRMKVASDQAAYFKEVNLLNSLIRIENIFENYYFSENKISFNGLRILEDLSLPLNYQSLLFLPFIIGLLYSFKNALNKNVISVILIISFAIILILMSYYLKLDWARYYIHLTLYFVLFQSLGLFIAIKNFPKTIKILLKVANKVKAMKIR